MTEREYFGICKAARRYALTLSRPDVDWRDLAHEAAVKQLRGKKYTEGAMKDAVRQLPLFGRCGTNYYHRYKIVPLPKQVPELTLFSDNLVMGRIARVIDSLPEAWRYVLEKYYRDGWTFHEIAQSLSVTDPRVVQMRTLAIERIRERLGAAEATLRQQSR